MTNEASCAIIKVQKRKELIKMTVWMNKEHGNIHFSVKEMLQEARELYDIDDPTNDVPLNEYYTCMTI